MATTSRIHPSRLKAVDLSNLSEPQMAALRQEAMRRGCSFPELLGQLVDEMSKRILPPDEPQKAA